MKDYIDTILFFIVLISSVATISWLLTFISDHIRWVP